jgi:hypothetical protein
MDYEIIFEISKSGLGISAFALPGFLFIAIGIVMYKFPKVLARGWSEKWAKRFASFWLVFSIFWTATALLSTGSKQASVREAYSSGNYKVIEGVVKNFDPMPASGHKMESFTVNGVKFEYSDSVVTPGFNNATSKGGPIHEGLPVKISHIGNTILKLEVAKNANKALRVDR